MAGRRRQHDQDMGRARLPRTAGHVSLSTVATVASVQPDRGEEVHRVNVRGAGRCRTGASGVGCRVTRIAGWQPVRPAMAGPESPPAGAPYRVRGPENRRHARAGGRGVPNGLRLAGLLVFLDPPKPAGSCRDRPARVDPRRDTVGKEMRAMPSGWVGVAVRCGDRGRRSGEHVGCPHGVGRAGYGGHRAAGHGFGCLRWHDEQGRAGHRVRWWRLPARGRGWCTSPSRPRACPPPAGGSGQPHAPLLSITCRIGP
jgi:hypothetical protein